MVLDENDNAPVVIQPLQKVISVREKQPIGTVVAQIVAADPDQDENATLQYDFKKGKSWYNLRKARMKNSHTTSSFQMVAPTTHYSPLIKMTAL